VAFSDFHAATDRAEVATSVLRRFLEIQSRHASAGDVESQFDAQGNLRRLASNQPLSWSAANQLSRAVQLPVSAP
jgi:hypothetical protein